MPRLEVIMTQWFLRSGVVCLMSLAAIALAAPDASAQEDSGGTPPPAHISILDGSATHEREGRVEPAQTNMAVAPGDRIRTEEGRMELQFGDASLLHLDRHTTVDVMADTLFRLGSGRVLLTVSSNAASGPELYRVDTPNGSVRIQQPGEYRISSLTGTMGNELEVAVLRGLAELATAEETMPVRAGERSLVRGDQLPSYPTPFNSARRDAFDLWSEQRRESRVGAASTHYLPPEVHTYAGVFDRHGSWGHDPSYGHVWYPSVAAAWRPYYNGSWLQTRRWGAFWLGGDPWAWPTHHFGRWGFSSRGRWFWIPARRWGPAWVSWAIAPGYIGWCPLGFNGRPVFGLTSVRARDLHLARGVYDPWRAWTVMPRRHFGSFTRVPSVMVDWRHLGPGVRSAFVTQNAVPAFARGRASTTEALPGYAPRMPSAGVALDRGTPASSRRSPYELAAPRYRASPGSRTPRADAPATAPAPDYPEFRRRGAERTTPTRDNYGIAVPRGMRYPSAAVAGTPGVQPRLAPPGGSAERPGAPAAASPDYARPRTYTPNAWPEPRQWRGVAPPSPINEPFRRGGSTSDRRPGYNDGPAARPQPGYTPRFRGPSSAPSAPAAAPPGTRPGAAAPRSRGESSGASPRTAPPPQRPGAAAPRQRN